MIKRFVVTHVGSDGDTILAHDATSEEVFRTVVSDVLAADVLPEHDEESRQAAVEMTARMMGFEDPSGPLESSVAGRDYRVDELPEDPQACDELLNARLRSPRLIQLVRRYSSSKLRYIIYPNESKHPGRPHCTVATSDKAANFSLPDAIRLVGDIRPHEKEAVRTITAHGAELLDLWNRMRPEDQKLRRGSQRSRS